MTVTVYQINEDGEESPIQLSFSDFSPNEVYIVVDDIARMIYIWKGNSAPVRKKFISARTASKIRQKTGLTFKVNSLDQSEEGSKFLALMGSPAAAESAQTKPSGPVAAARPSNVPRAAPTSQPAARPASTPSSQPVMSARPRTPTPSPSPAPAQPAARPVSTSAPVRPAPAPTPVSTPKKEEVVMSSQARSAGVTKEHVNDILEKLKDLEVPEGLQREIVIIRNKVFSATKEYHKLFQKEVIRLDPMDDLPPGAFPASDYYTRLYIENGEVLFIELLSEIPRTERDEFLSEVRASLRDLTKLGI